MNLKSWGLFPAIKSKVKYPNSLDQVGSEGLARGLGRSYGDSALAEVIQSSDKLNLFCDFDPATGLLKAQAGVSFDQILKIFVPKGWFLPVSTGTKFVTLGGALASDVHGKNHHLEGCFSDHVINFTLYTKNQGWVNCSRDENSDLFYATMGGMGLTGFIGEVSLKLKPIESSYIKETVVKAKNLGEVFSLFEEFQDTTYTVAWIDCLSTGSKLGRSLLMAGEHAKRDEVNKPDLFKVHSDPLLNVPLYAPAFLLNSFTIKVFNFLYYHKSFRKRAHKISHYEPFFYPLDAIKNWNKLYGKKGFTQYQFVVPKKGGFENMKKILETISQSGKGSFLAVLKAFGPANDNDLSFPSEGYTLALDFKLEDSLYPLLDQLDELVLACGGRVYLTKDVRMSEASFKSSYPKWEKFNETRRRYGSLDSIYSLQSKRLGL